MVDTYNDEMVTFGASDGSSVIIVYLDAGPGAMISLDIDGNIEVEGELPYGYETDSGIVIDDTHVIVAGYRSNTTDELLLSKLSLTGEKDCGTSVVLSLINITSNVIWGVESDSIIDTIALSQ